MLNSTQYLTPRSIENLSNIESAYRVKHSTLKFLREYVPENYPMRKAWNFLWKSHKYFFNPQHREERLLIYGREVEVLTEIIRKRHEVLISSAKIHFGSSFYDYGHDILSIQGYIELEEEDSRSEELLFLIQDFLEKSMHYEGLQPPFLRIDSLSDISSVYPERETFILKLLSKRHFFLKKKRQGENRLQEFCNRMHEIEEKRNISYIAIAVSFIATVAFSAMAVTLTPILFFPATATFSIMGCMSYHLHEINLFEKMFTN